MPLLKAFPAPPFRPGIDRLYPDSTRGNNHDIDTHGARFRNGKAPQITRRRSSVLATDDGGGQAGTIVIASYAYGSMAANQTVYANYYPGGGNILYAPTMKAPGKACLEGTTIYGYGTPSVGFWDFCIPNNSTFHNSKTVDGTFLSTYVRDLGDGLPMYSVLVTADPANPAGWHGALYNYSGGFWEDIYANLGDGSIYNGEGWSILETHYHAVGSECDLIPAVQSDSIRLDGVNVNTNQTNAFQYGQCFGQTTAGVPTSAYGPEPYVFTMLAPNFHWQVVTQQPPPTPAPTSTPPADLGGNCGRIQCITS